MIQFEHPSPQDGDEDRYDQRERDYHNLWHDETDRAELAEQRADDAEKALRRIAYWPFDVMSTAEADIQAIKNLAAAAVVSAEPTP